MAVGLPWGSQKLSFKNAPEPYVKRCWIRRHAWFSFFSQSLKGSYRQASKALCKNYPTRHNNLDK